MWSLKLPLSTLNNPELVLHFAVLHHLEFVQI